MFKLPLWIPALALLAAPAIVSAQDSIATTYNIQVEKTSIFSNQSYWVTVDSTTDYQEALESYDVHVLALEEGFIHRMVGHNDWRSVITDVRLRFVRNLPTLRGYYSPWLYNSFAFP